MIHITTGPDGKRTIVDPMKHIRSHARPPTEASTPGHQDEPELHEDPAALREQLRLIRTLWNAGREGTMQGKPTKWFDTAQTQEMLVALGLAGVPQDENTWSWQDANAAYLEGWGIFAEDDAEGRAEELVDGKPYGLRPFTLCRVDELALFKHDREAQQYVFGAVMRHGHPLGLKALAFLFQHSRAEFDTIVPPGASVLHKLVRQYHKLHAEGAR